MKNKSILILIITFCLANTIWCQNTVRTKVNVSKASHNNVSGNDLEFTILNNSKDTIIFWKDFGYISTRPEINENKNWKELDWQCIFNHKAVLIEIPPDSSFVFRTECFNGFGSGKYRIRFEYWIKENGIDYSGITHRSFENKKTIIYSNTFIIE